MRRMFVMVIALLAGCTAGADENRGLPVTVHDSAGVRIVTAESLDSLPALTPGEPVVDLASSTEAGEASFSRVRVVHRMPDGRVIVGDGAARRLKVFAPDGSFLRSLGDGDNEYLAVDGIWAVGGDRIAVRDQRRGTITIQGLDGTPGRTIDLESVQPNDRPIGRLTSGDLLFRRLGTEVAASGFDTMWVAIVRYSAEGGSPDTVGVWPGSRMGRVGEPPVQLVTRPIFEPPFVAAATGERIVTADCRTPTFRLLHPEGGLAGLVRWPADPIRVTDDDVREYRAPRLAGLDSERRRSARRVLDALPVNPEFPACDRLLLDPAGRTWVRAFARPGASHGSWLVFDPAGRPLFSVQIPAAARVMSVDGDFITTLEHNPLDVPRVRVYRLR